MATVSIKTLASEVATLLGESLAPECEPLDSPFPDIEDRVRVSAPIILTDLILDANPDELFDGKRLTGGFSINSDGTATLELPDNFLRLAYLKMSEWSRPVTKITGFTDPEFAMQTSPWEGIRGTLQRPVVTEVVGKDGVRSLLLYSCSDKSTPESCIYWERPSVSATDTIEVPSALYLALLRKLEIQLSSLKAFPP